MITWLYVLLFSLGKFLFIKVQGELEFFMLAGVVILSLTKMTQNLLFFFAQMLIKGCSCIKAQISFCGSFCVCTYMCVMQTSTGKYEIRPALMGTFLADHSSSSILQSTFAKIFQDACNELLPSQYLMCLICIVYVSGCLNKLIEILICN